jgi:hypothetical protein
MVPFNIFIDVRFQCVKLDGDETTLHAFGVGPSKTSKSLISYLLMKKKRLLA